MFSYEFCKIFNNTFFIEHLQETAFVMTQWLRKGLSFNLIRIRDMRALQIL